MADMTPAQERQRTIQLDKQRAKYEREWEGKIHAAIMTAIRPFGVAVRQRGPAYAANNIQSLVTDEAMAGVIRRLYRSVGVTAANSEYGFVYGIYGEEMNSQKAFGFNREWADIMQNLFAMFGAARVVKIMQTERARLLRELLQGQEDGIDNYNLAERLMGAEIPWRRAKVIARTETGTAGAYGSDAAARSLGLMFDKTWKSIQDKRVRRIPDGDHADHGVMNNVKVQQDDKFVVPGIPAPNLMDHPHDFEAPPYQTINCRCVVIRKPLRDASGRLIRTGTNTRSMYNRQNLVR